jgi:hypothetical protein
MAIGAAYVVVGLAYFYSRDLDKPDERGGGKAGRVSRRSRRAIV